MKYTTIYDVDTQKRRKALIGRPCISNFAWQQKCHLRNSSDYSSYELPYVFFKLDGFRINNIVFIPAIETKNKTQNYRCQ